MKSELLKLQLKDALRKMESILRTKNRSSNEYTKAVRSYQRLLHLVDSNQSI